MNFLITVIDDQPNSASGDEMAAIVVFNDRLVADGHWIFAGGLGSPSNATVIDNRNNANLLTEGPFIESKEYLSGFWIITAPNLEVALKLATESSKACNRKVELRPFLGE